MIFKGMYDEASTEVESEPQSTESTEEVSSPEQTPSTEAVETQDPQELLRAMREDREKDSAKLKAFEQQNEFYRNVAMQNMQKQQQNPNQMSPQQQAAKFQQDDILTYAEMQEEFNSQLGTVQQQMQQMRGQMDEELTKTQHPDFEDVIDQLVVPLIRANPKLMDEINQQPRPALYAYKLGCMTPEYIAYQQKTATEKVTSKIEKNLSKPKTLGNAGSTNAKHNADDFSKMSSEEFAKRRAELLGFN